MRKGIKECIFSLVCSYRFMLIVFRVFVSVDLFLCFSLVLFFLCIPEPYVIFYTRFCFVIVLSVFDIGQDSYVFVFDSLL